MLSAEETRAVGRDCGFDLVRISRAAPLHEARVRYLDWIAGDRQGEMRWISAEWAERSTDPIAEMPGVRSIISVGLTYWSGHRTTPPPNAGVVARYAWGADYHRVMGDRLREFAERLQQESGGDQRWYVDTGPMMDRVHAERSGLGWYGKNTNILTESFGSFVVLGEVLTTLEIEPDAPLTRGCGACRLCVVACPTGALGPEYTLDSRRCISYLTIEHRGAIPRELRPLMGAWVFGCDICQDVCPPTMRPYLQTDQERSRWAASTRALVRRDGSDSATSPAATRPPVNHPLFENGIRPALDLVWLLHLTHDGYLEAFRETSIKRAKVWMLRRNAAVALGNVGDPETIGALARSLSEDENPIVRGHAAWALARLAARHGCGGTYAVLESAVSGESDTYVVDEIRQALADLESGDSEA